MKKTHIGTIFLFLSFYIFGCWVSNDFGISWDENQHRVFGQKTVIYIVKYFGFDHLIQIPDGLNEFGPEEFGVIHYSYIFDGLSAVVEELYPIQDMRDIFLFRHWLNWTFYFFGFLGFFLLLNETIRSRYVVFISSLFYLLHPRLFGHGFFNLKDSIAQAFVAIAIYLCLRYFRFRSTINGVFAGLLFALCIITRMVTIYIPFLFLFFLVIDDKILKGSFITRNFKYYLTFLISIFIGVYILHPYLWDDPINSFISIVKEQAKYPWIGNNFFLGEYISASNLPWYYIPTWISVTTPLPFLMLLAFGSFVSFKKNFMLSVNETLFRGFMFLGFVIPILTVIILNSTLYDGWRHMFFIYPFLAFFMANGFAASVEWFNERLKFGIKITTILFGILVFIGPLYSIITMHPHQQVFFNVLAGKDPMLKFEGGDYWGTSFRKGLEWITENDDRDSICVVVNGTPGSLNRHMIKEEERKRLHFKIQPNLNELTVKSGDYYLTNFRSQQAYGYPHTKNKFPVLANEVYAINTNGMKIMAVYNLE